MCCLFADTTPKSYESASHTIPSLYAGWGLSYRLCTAEGSGVQGTDRSGSGKQVTHALLVNHTPTQLHSLLANQSELDRAGLAGGESSALGMLKCQLAVANLQPQTVPELTAVSRVVTLYNSFAVLVSVC